ncbi:hypothetical protein BH09PSE5_BH09PSE5_08570 [soil metagenome]
MNQSDQPMSQPADDVANTAAKPMAPGDEAPAGTPGTGENVCPTCGGSGRSASGTCPTCQGLGKVTVGVGGA